MTKKDRKIIFLIYKEKGCMKSLRDLRCSKCPLHYNSKKSSRDKVCTNLGMNLVAYNTAKKIIIDHPEEFLGELL